MSEYEARKLSLEMLIRHGYDVDHETREEYNIEPTDNGGENPE